MEKKLEKEKNIKMGKQYLKENIKMEKYGTEKEKDYVENIK